MKKKRSSQSEAPKTPAEEPDARGPPSFPIVGIGASAGGLEAFRELLGSLPTDTGMGFVLVQHLDPEHESALVDLLGRATSLPVSEITNDQPVEPNHVYVIPRGTKLTIAGGILKLAPRERTRTPHRPIDVFFESLARDRHSLSVGVVLSGTGSDGTLGLEAIKTAGGIAFAQDDSAKHDSMPRSAAASGCVDLILSPAEIAKELARIASHPYLAEREPEDLENIEDTLSRDDGAGEDERAAATAREDRTALPAGGRPTESDTLHGGERPARAQATEATSHDTEPSGDNGYKQILLLLRNHSGVDFSLYKSATIQRRINRRVVVSAKGTLSDYAAFLRGNAKELDRLYSDVLISVTSFFRDASTFEILQRDVLPRLLEQGGDDPIRCWVLGCSTGQEAYSIVIAFLEAMDKAPRVRKLQVFATDLNDALLDKARHGLYAKSLADDLEPRRLERFFVEQEGGYRVNKMVRETVVFARQNLISDPPFSRMDLISCRNLLIYFEPSLQKKALPTFHYALKPGGFLLLGASESTSGFTELFETVDKKHKIYVKKPAATPVFHLPMWQEHGARPAHGGQPAYGSRPSLPIGHAAEPESADGVRGELNAQREADRITVSQFSPPGVLVNAELEILQFRGPTGAYLEPPSGKASFNVLKMAREGLMLPLRAAIDESRKQNQSVRRERVRITRDGDTYTVDVQVIPLKNLRERCFLILFEDADGLAPTTAPKRREPSKPPLSKSEEASRIADLEVELAETREYLQAVQEQYEGANEALQAANEEAQSANEELQSINEELETSKEELESANEELKTVNDEMSTRNVELNYLNNDLVNLQTSSKLAIVLLARDLTIRRFSQQAEQQLDLIAADVGRSIKQIRHGLVDANQPSPSEASGSTDASAQRQAPCDLARLAGEVIAEVRGQDREVLDKDGRCHSLRVRPYITIDNKVDGAVIVLVDIDAVKRSEIAIADARDYAENTIGAIRDSLLVLNGELRIEMANGSFYRTFHVAPAETVGELVYELGNGQWDIPRLRELLEEIVPQDTVVEDFEVEHEFEQIGKRVMLLNARRISDKRRERERILLTIADVTSRKRAEDAVRQLNAELRDQERRLTTELASTRALQAASTHMVRHGDEDALYDAVLDAVVTIMGSDCASLQILHPERGPAGELRLLGHRGFSPEAAQFWEWVRPASESPCGAALRTKQRVMVRDVRECEWMAGSEDAAQCAQTGVRAVQSTPLVSRSGDLLGMLSTHWREPHEPLERTLQLLDVLARQAADLLDRKRTEDVIRRSEAKYRTIFESAAVSLWEEDFSAVHAALEGLRTEGVTDFSGYLKEHPEFVQEALGLIRVVDVNDTTVQLFGARDKSELLGALPQMFPPESISVFVEELVAVAEGRTTMRGEALLNTLSGHPVTVLFTMTLASAAKKYDRVLFSAVDISERSRLEIETREQAAALATQDRRKDEFLAILSHELRNPLAPIASAARLLSLEREVESPTGRRALAIIERQVDQLTRLVNDLLEVSRITTGRLDLRCETVALAEIVQKAVETVGPVIEQGRHTLSVSLPSEPVWVHADAARLEQVVVNLLTNSAKFTDDGGQIELTLRLEGEAAVLRVKDSGIGIDPELLPHVFDLFTQAQRSLDRSQGGLGLGLSLVHRLVKLHGGTVKAESVVGQGSEFVVRLPLTAAPSSISASIEPAQASGKPRRVLVVDDNVDSAESLAMLLAAAHHDVRTAHDGQSALETILDYRPDVVLLDIGMPKLNGYEIAARIRQLPEVKHIVLVAVTGYGQEGDRQRSRAAGFDHHLVKPVDFDMLRRIIESGQ